MKYQNSLVWCRRFGWLLGLVALLSGFAPRAMAQLTQIPGTTTSMTSTADRMISYRQQEHSWQTSDGAIHLMVNRGTVASGQSLVLYSSFDAGATWTQMFALGGTDQFSTSDGVLNSNTRLLLTYASAQSTGKIMYVLANYVQATHTWALGTPQVVFTSTTQAGSNPALTIDDAGGIWCGFTAQGRTSNFYNIQMMYRSASATTWTNTGLVFGTTDASTQHSARPVRVNGGVGMVYANGQSMFWASRQDGWAINTPWVTTTLYTGLPPVSKNPYDSHFTVQADANTNLYLAFVNNGQLIYMRYLSDQASWGAPITMSPSINAAYPQVTLAGGNVVIMVNNVQMVEVWQSTDNGATFTATQLLTHTVPPPGSTLDYTNPRVEAPGHAQNPIPTWQQFISGTTQELMYFKVPVVTSPK